MKRALFLFVFGLMVAAPAIGAKPPKPPRASSVTIAAVPSKVTFGASTTISGKVTARRAAGVTVTLESKVFPYTAGFTRVKDTTTNAIGVYSFKIVPTINTIYRVTAQAAPRATSTNALVGVRVKVSLAVSTLKPAVGQLVRFHGFVLPAYNGQFAQIQRKTTTGWKTVARVKLVAATALRGVARSRFSKRLKISRNGTYRARFAPADGSRLPNTSPTRRLTVH